MVNTDTSYNPKVSVVIASYNYAGYICHAIDSVLNQTFDDFEIVIVNDGSTDNTQRIIQPYLSDERITYIYQENAGQANAKNNGIKNSSGEFIAFLDADDLWKKTKLEKQIPLFSNKNVGVVYSRSRFVDQQGNIVEYKVESKYLLPKSGEVTKALFFDNFVPFSSSVVRRECFEEHGCFDESIMMGIDWDLWLRLSMCYRFEFISEQLLLYRVGHSGQMSKNLEERQKCSDKIMQKFYESNPGLLPLSTIRHAWAYTYSNRGYYYSHLDSHRSSEYYLLSIQKWPLQFAAYKGLIKNFFCSI